MRPAAILAALTGLAACSAPAPREATEAAAAAAGEAAPGLPAVDIYVAPLTWSDGLPQAAMPVNLTRRPGYDNQPAFSSDGQDIYFTSGDDEHTDIWRMGRDGSGRLQITDTPDSGEYSPRPTPAGGVISYIYQPPGGYGGQVWLDDPDGANARPASEAGPNGYYAFNADMTRLAVFALGDTFRLQVFGRFEDTQTVTVADGIGRALYASPDHDRLYFTLPRESGGHAVHETDFAGRQTSFVFDLPGQTEDYAVFAMPDGSDGFFAVDGGVLKLRTRATPWQAVADLSQAGLTGISRLAVSPDRSHIAIVADDPAGQ